MNYPNFRFCFSIQITFIYITLNKFHNKLTNAAFFFQNYLRLYTMSQESSDSNTEINTLNKHKTNIIDLCERKAPNGSVNELSFKIDGFDVHFDPCGNMGCLNIQDKLIIGLLRTAFILSVPFLNLDSIFFC